MAYLAGSAPAISEVITLDGILASLQVHTRRTIWPNRAELPRAGPRLSMYGKSGHASVILTCLWSVNGCLENLHSVPVPYT